MVQVDRTPAQSGGKATDFLNQAQLSFRAEKLTGIAVGLLLFAGLGITVDTYAEHRARIYLEAILELP